MKLLLHLLVVQVSQTRWPYKILRIVLKHNIPRDHSHFAGVDFAENGLQEKQEVSRTTLASIYSKLVRQHRHALEFNHEKYEHFFTTFHGVATTF